MADSTEMAAFLVLSFHFGVLPTALPPPADRGFGPQKLA